MMMNGAGLGLVSCPVCVDANVLVRSIYFSDSGWTDTFNCEKWLDEVFIPFAREHHVDSSKPIVLFMDGHETHETPELQRVIYKHLDGEDLEIIIFCFPSKTTHKCQPLDVVILSSVERKWQDVCDQCVKDHVTVNRFNVIPLYVCGTRSALIRDLIKTAFEKTGIHPINRAVFQPEDFAPSKAVSSASHTPDSFPADFPSSGPMIPSDAEDEDFDPKQEEADSHLEWDSGPGSVLNKMEQDDDSLEMRVQNDSLALDLDLASSDLGSEALDSDSSPSDTDSESNIVDEDQGEAQFLGDNTQNEPLPLSGLMKSLANLENDIIHMTRSTSSRLNLFRVAPPKVVSLEEDSQLSSDARLQEIRQLHQQLMGAYQALGCAMAQLSASNAHCTTIHRELDHVRRQLDHATKKKERGSKKIKARFLTSRSLRAEFDKEDAERKERERVAKEKSRQKEAERVEINRQIMADGRDRIFTGSISSYKKKDIQGLALALGLADTGTVEELKTWIAAKFDEHPELKENDRFVGLFTRSRSARRPAESQTNPEMQIPAAISSHPPQTRTDPGMQIPAPTAVDPPHHFQNLSALHPPAPPHQLQAFPGHYPYPYHFIYPTGVPAQGNPPNPPYPPPNSSRR